MTQQHENDFAIQQIGQTHLQETSATSRAAAATAMVQARCVMAMQRPRDWDTVRTRLLHECERPGFADVAIYRKPVGGGRSVEGKSIRFAEAAMRHLTNFHIWTETTYNDEELMTIQVTAMDLETNVTTSEEVSIQKTVERQNSSGRVVIAERKNSFGKTVFVVLATDEELVTKVRAALSKARRNLILQLLPGDIADDCEAKCRETQAARDKSDPDAAKKRLFDAFAKIGVTPSQIKSHLGHSNQLSPAELQQLRGVYAAISTGETTWAAVTEDQRGDQEKRKAEVLASVAESTPVSIPEPKQAKRSKEPSPEDDGR